jgi:hypothetical protein
MKTYRLYQVQQAGFRERGIPGAGAMKSKHPHQDTIETLELFIEKAEELAHYAATTHSFGGLLGVFRRGDEEAWQMHPEIRGLLLTFRMFIQSNENIAIFPVSIKGQLKRPKLLDLTGLSAQWHEHAERAYINIVALFCGYDEAKKVQNSPTGLYLDRDLKPLPTGYSYNNTPISRWEILDTFLYGFFSHTTKRDTFKQWQQEPELMGNLNSVFVDIVGFISGQIWELMKISKQELHRLTASTEQEERGS